MSDYIYTTIKEQDGTIHYYETFTNPNGIWDNEGRVDYRVQTRELPYEEWFLAQIIYG